MGDDSLWPVAVIPVGQVSAASALWLAKERLSVTVVLKACFRIVHGGQMTRLPPTRMRRDRGEVVPYLTQADIVVTAAHAYHRGSRPAAAVAVRLALFRRWAVLDKSLLVYPVNEVGERASVVTNEIPVVKAAADQPSGILLNPHDMSKAGTLGPLDDNSPERRALLGDHPAPLTDSGIFAIPTMFPWSYFQNAPADQRTSYLRGDEWLVLEGMSHNQDRIQSQLPAARAEVYVYPPGLTTGPIYPVQMEADQLRIDADAGHCAVLWRGSFPVADEHTARSLVLIGGVATARQPVSWPDLESIVSDPFLRAHGWRMSNLPAEVEVEVEAQAEAQAEVDEVISDEDAASLARTTNRSPEETRALFNSLEAQSQTDRDGPGSGEEPANGSVESQSSPSSRMPSSVTGTAITELEVDDEGILSVQRRGDSILEAVVGRLDEPEQAVEGRRPSWKTRRKHKMRRTALGLPVSGSRVLRAAHATAPEVRESSSGDASSTIEAPQLEKQSVNQLETSLSDALSAQGIGTIDDLPWRAAGASGGRQGAGGSGEGNDGPHDIADDDEVHAQAKL